MTSKSLPQGFLRKKAKILEQLSIPDSEYHDLSPKDSVDIQIRDLIDEINGVEGLVTTSSCAGRVSVFLEGEKKKERVEEDVGEDEMRAKTTTAGTGGKGGGGRWLYVNHDPIVVEEMRDDTTAFLGLKRKEGGFKVEELAGRRVHFKYEGFILHVLTASLTHAQTVLQAAMQAGFRESGALNLVSATSDPPSPMVAVRSQGMSLESIIGCAIPSATALNETEEVCTVPESNLRVLVALSNERFQENTRRIERFRTLLREGLRKQAEGGVKKGKDGEVWEDADARRERKKAEGLKMREEARARKQALAAESTYVVDEAL